MELRHLRYFVAVAEALHFTRAAEQQLVAQSALSQQIAGLERELDVRLFDRGGRTVSLTDAGQALLPLARRVLGDVEAITVEMDARAGLRRGTLRIGLLQSPATSIDVVQVMGSFHERYPGITFTITDAPSEQMAAAVAAGDLDVALVGLEPHELPATVSCLLLAVDPLVAVVARDHPLASRRLVSIPELVAQGQFIHFAKGSGLRRRVEHGFARASTPLVGSFEVGQIIDMIRLAGHGIGVTIVPRTDALEAEHAVEPFAVIPLADPDAVHPVSLVFNPARLSRAAEVFVDEAAHRLLGRSAADAVVTGTLP